MDCCDPCPWAVLVGSRRWAAPSPGLTFHGSWENDSQSNHWESSDQVGLPQPSGGIMVKRLSVDVSKVNQ